MVDPEEVVVLDLVKAGRDEGHHEPCVSTSEDDDHGAEADPEGAVGDEVHELEVELSEDAVRGREGAVVNHELADLNRVLHHVKELQEHEETEEPEERVAAQLSLGLRGYDRDPRNDEAEPGSAEGGAER